MSVIFWSVVCLDAALFSALLVSMLVQSGGSSSGGREMGVFFFVIVPVILIGTAVLLYVFSRSQTWKILALIIVAGPGLFIAGSQIRSAYIDYVVRQNTLGRGYFSSAAMNDLGAAVIQGDLAALQRLGPTIDLNVAGERGKTLIGMATEQASGAPDQKRARRSLAVIETLLRLGAKPGPAMSAALEARDPAVLAALLKAGGDPNALTEQGSPLVFEWLNIMPVENLRLLIQHGLDVNVVQYDTPLAVEVTLKRRFDLLLLLAQSGADLSKPRGDGRNVAGELAVRVEEARAEGREPPADLLKVRELLDAR